MYPEADQRLEAAAEGVAVGVVRELAGDHLVRVDPVPYRAKVPWNSFEPEEEEHGEQLKSVVGFRGSPPSPAYQDSQGTTVDRHGVPAFWQAAATGFVVSGVDVVRIRSAWPVMSCCATWAALVGFDWLSWTFMLIL